MLRIGCADIYIPWYFIKETIAKDDKRTHKDIKPMRLERFTVVSTVLRDLIYISYRVPSSRIRALVPPALPLHTLGDQVFVSVVIMRNTDVGPVWLPRPRPTYNQLNIRTYVHHPVTGQNGVYFFKSGITSLFALIVPRLLGLPWQHIKLRIEAGKDALGADQYNVNGDFHGEVAMEASKQLRNEKSDSPSTRHDDVIHITTPDIGFVTSTDRETLLYFPVEHQFVEPASCSLISFRFPLIQQIGLITREELSKPDSILLVPATNFLVHLPPKRLRIVQNRPTRGKT
jgi:uncharacterized protein YqjF (DUF2071 family)